MNPAPPWLADFLARLPAHAISLSLTHNEHKGYHETLEAWEETLRAGCGATSDDPAEIGWVSAEQRARAFAADDVWELHWFPYTPVGSHTLLACDLGVLIEEACKGGHASWASD
jgi:hypothetical protein